MGVAPVGWKDSHAQRLLTDASTKTQSVPQRTCRSAWARLIAKVYEIDPLVRPRCASEMSDSTIDVLNLAAGLPARPAVWCLSE